MAGRKLAEEWLHLGLGATAVPQPPFTGMDWYAAYGERHASDGTDGRLVAEIAFTEDWAGWEMHPAGEELVYCISGRMELIQEFPDGRIEETTLGPGQYAINPRGVWHTANIPEPSSALFITAGIGTQNRPR